MNAKALAKTSAPRPLLSEPQVIPPLWHPPLRQRFFLGNEPLAIPPGEHLLGQVWFGKTLTSHVHTGASVGVEMPPLQGERLTEAWFSPQEPAYGNWKNIRFTKTESVLFGVARYPSTPIESQTFLAYQDIITLMRAAGFSQFLRVWNYFPAINCEEAGLERYQSFCRGRHESLDKAGLLINEELPAASAVGSDQGDALTIIFIASKGLLKQVENPRQVSAFHYPERYGPRSPSFSRAVHWQQGTASQLFISGTASIVGHLSLGEDSIRDQTLIMLANLEALIGKISRIPIHQLGQRVVWKVYLRRSEDLPLVEDLLSTHLDSRSEIAYLRGDICRNPLLIEIEGLLNL